MRWIVVTAMAVLAFPSAGHAKRLEEAVWSGLFSRWAHRLEAGLSALGAGAHLAKNGAHPGNSNDNNGNNGPGNGGPPPNSNERVGSGLDPSGRS